MLRAEPGQPVQARGEPTPLRPIPEFPQHRLRRPVPVLGPHRRQRHRPGHPPHHRHLVRLPKDRAGVCLLGWYLC